MLRRETAHVRKRILIAGEGSLGETRLDHRANSPAFRLSTTCMLHNLDIDMTGFCEAVLIEGAKHVQPLLQRCIVRSVC